MTTALHIHARILRDLDARVHPQIAAALREDKMQIAERIKRATPEQLDVLLLRCAKFLIEDVEAM